jgi:SAM-dependent methyltransferase
MASTLCRNCNKKLNNIFLDLGRCPPSNSLIKNEQDKKREKKFQLITYVCDKCWLVQTKDVVNKKIFFNNHYPYFSSTSSSWLDHAKEYVLKISKKLKLNKKKFVIELASNDGYLLQYFKKKGIPCMGIEPSKNTSSIAKKRGIKTLDKFFSYNLAKKIKNKADLIIGNNVYAHVPNLNDFTKGIKELLKQKGTVTLEFPHLLNLIKYSQFDTIYHEHFSYFSLLTVKNIFQKHQLKIFFVEKLDTHGGSLRIYGCHANDKRFESKSVKNVIKEEMNFGLNKINTFKTFNLNVLKIKKEIKKFILQARKDKKIIHAYGAAAKGSTVLNYLNMKNKDIHFVYDAAKSKINKMLPGCHIKILSPDEIKIRKPDYIIIFPWNIKKEIIKNFKFIKKWKGKFITFIPKTKVHH